VRLYTIKLGSLFSQDEFGGKIRAVTLWVEVLRGTVPLAEAWCPDAACLYRLTCVSVPTLQQRHAYDKASTK